MATGASKMKTQPKSQPPTRNSNSNGLKCEIESSQNKPCEAAIFYDGIDLYCPIVSEANNTDHWTVKRKRKNHQKIEVISAMSHLNLKNLAKYPLLISIIRIGGRKMDDDNYQNAVKAIRDAIADQLNPGLAPGQADNSDQFSWVYQQQKGSPKRIRVEFLRRTTL